MNTNASVPFISIIVPIHNEEVYLERCIHALQSQLYPSNRYEIILVDDGSTDDSSSICYKYIKKEPHSLPNTIYIRMKHSGLSTARNIGLTVAQGEIITYIDGDAIAAPSWLIELSKPFVDPDVGVVGGKVQVLNDDKWFANFIHSVHYFPPTTEAILIGTNMAFKRILFTEFGGFQDVFWQRGDETSFLRKIKGRYKITHAKSAVVKHEHPSKAWQWLRERAKNGRFGLWEGWIDIMETTQSKRRLLFNLASRIINLLFMGSLLIFLVSMLFETIGLQFIRSIILILSIMFLVLFPVVIYRYGRHRPFKTMYSLYSQQPHKLLWAWLLIILGNTAEDIGFLTAYFSNDIPTKWSDSIDASKGQVEYLVANFDMPSLHR